MLEKIRKKFILLSMLAIAAVLLLVLMTINGFNYYRITKQLDLSLILILEQGGSLNGGAPPVFMTDSDRDFPLRPAEFPFRTRYFSVFLDAEDNIIGSNLQSIAAIDEGVALDLAESVLAEGDERGWINDYRYLVTQQAAGGLLIFVDASNELDMINSLLLISGLVTLGMFVILLTLIIFLSRRALRPFTESYTKQRQFITDAGHELKTPLTIIATNTEIMKMNAEENQWLLSTENQVQRMHNLISNMILLSRMDEGRLEEQRQEINLSEAAEAATASFAVLAATKGQSLHADIEPNIFLYRKRSGTRTIAGYSAG
jgi:signal transduction histidine kinase